MLYLFQLKSTVIAPVALRSRTASKIREEKKEETVMRLKGNQQLGKMKKQELKKIKKQKKKAGGFLYTCAVYCHHSFSVLLKHCGINYVCLCKSSMVSL